MLLLSLLHFCCSAQKLGVNTENKFSKTYQKYVDNQYDYEGRDTILKRFKIELESTLKNPQLNNYYFPEWDNEQKVAVSKDSLLTILSWDLRNNGTFHTYESMYRLVREDSIYSGFLFEKEKGMEEKKSAVYFEANKLPDNSYLIKGWGTHGGGKDFFIYRKLNYKDGSLSDCKGCFEGKDYLFYEKSRGYDLAINYNEENRSIQYPELVTDLIDGEESQFSRPTGKIIELIFKDGIFVKSKTE